MTAIPTTFGSGGSGLVPGGSGGNPDLATTLREIATDLAAIVGTTAVNAVAAGTTAAADIAAVVAADIAAVAAAAPAQTAVADADQTEGIMDGLVASDPTTPSSQAGGGGNLDWNVNLSAGYAMVNAVGKAEVAQGDFDVHSGAPLVANGQSAYAWIIEKNVGGVVTTDKVVGVAAATGAQVAPDDAAITAAAGTADWVKLALCLINRTGDAVVTQSQDISVRQMFGWGGAPLANDLKAKYNVTVTAVGELRTLAGTVRTLINELKTIAGTVRTLTNESKADYNTTVTLINELRTAILAGQAVVLDTTAP